MTTPTIAQLHHGSPSTSRAALRNVFLQSESMSPTPIPAPPAAGASYSSAFKALATCNLIFSPSGRQYGSDDVVASSPEYPGIFGQGADPDAAVASFHGALQAVKAARAAAGITFEAPIVPPDERWVAFVGQITPRQDRGYFLSTPAARVVSETPPAQGDR